jgi:hypothetical protein
VIITTKSGTEYEFDLVAGKVRRCTYTGGGELRRDDDWLKFTFAPFGTPLIGHPMVLLLEPLGEGNVTIRTTSSVVSIDER